MQAVQQVQQVQAAPPKTEETGTVYIEENKKLFAAVMNAM